MDQQCAGPLAQHWWLRISWLRLGIQATHPLGLDGKGLSRFLNTRDVHLSQNVECKQYKEDKLGLSSGLRTVVDPATREPMAARLVNNNNGNNNIKHQATGNNNRNKQATHRFLQRKGGKSRGQSLTWVFLLLIFFATQNNFRYFVCHPIHESRHLVIVIV